VIDWPKVYRLLRRCLPSPLEWDKHEASGQKYYDLCASMGVCECFVLDLQCGTHGGGVTLYVHKRSLHILRISNVLLFHYMCLHRIRYYTVPHIPTHPRYPLPLTFPVCVCAVWLLTHAKSAAASPGITLYI